MRLESPLVRLGLAAGKPICCLSIDNVIIGRGNNVQPITAIDFFDAATAVPEPLPEAWRVLLMAAAVCRRGKI